LTYAPKHTQHTSLLTRPISYSYRITIGPRNRVRNLESQRKARNVASKATSEAMTVKTDQKDFSPSHRYFIKHLIVVLEKQS
jgi:hypothetical protein